MRRSNRAWNKPKKNKAFFKLRVFLFFVLIFFAMLIIHTVSSFDRKILPIAISISEMDAKNKINNIIYNSVNTVSAENGLNTADFYSKIEDGQGRVLSLSVNTLLVNDTCAKIAAEISKEMEHLQDEAIEIPIGVLTGFESFANMGPKYTIEIMPAGNVIADYETKFEAVGINQVNFQVWINVMANIQVLIPLNKQEISISRKVAIVNTIFSGQVPETYLNIPHDK